jgi:hypothetical protein
MKILNIILCVLFLAFAGLQFNDDPDDIWFWVVAYGSVGIISGLAAFGRYNMWLILVAIGVILFKMFMYFTPFAQWIDMGAPSIVGEMKATEPYIETTREFLGLVLCLIVLIFQYVQYTKWKKALKE